MSFVIKSPRHSGLVGDDECEIAGFIDGSYCFPRPAHSFETFRFEDIAVVLVKNSVAVEENGWSSH